MEIPSQSPCDSISIRLLQVQVHMDILEGVGHAAIVNVRQHWLWRSSSANTSA
ncbi:hypothetical protein JKG47_08790 [Acidithiobacillus sp. MC6.1]|nr:hypothetical protein [Acidithiobacillus sp. MC6.1]